MENKRYTAEEVLNLQSAAYQKGLNEGYELRKKEAQPAQRWVKASTPGIKDGHYVAKYKPDDIQFAYDPVGMAFVDADRIHFVCPSLYDIEWAKGHEELKYLQLLDEQPVAVSQDAHEKEVMMQAFDKVRQIFVGRQWIMEGRGSYPYNDDRYQQEVRYMYDEFDQVVKDTWANIKSKSVDYRKAIIAEYLESAAPAAGREEDLKAQVEKLTDALESIANGAPPANNDEAWSWIGTARLLAEEALMRGKEGRP